MSQLVQLVQKNCTRLGKRVYCACDALERIRDNIADPETLLHNLPYLKKQFEFARGEIDMGLSLIKDLAIEALARKTDQGPEVLHVLDEVALIELAGK